MASRHSKALVGAGLFVLGVGTGAAVPASMLLATGPAQSADGPSVATRLQQIEDRDAIHKLLINYGRTLDARDFAGFADLWAEDADYVGGGPTGTAHGPQAIRAALEKTFQANPSGVAGPNFHLFFDETIDLDGDQATSTSKGAFVIQAADNHPQMLILATYHDTFVRRNGGWKFQRREVRGEIPAPRQAASN